MTKSIPAFTEAGTLPKWIHRCTGEVFLERYCEGDDVRCAYYKAITDIFDFARSRNARYLFVGGSFITKEKEPSDFDVVIVFSKREHIPTKGERLLIEGKKADIMFCSEDEPNIVDAFVHLFSHGRFDQELGIIQVDLCGVGADWQVRHMPDEEELNIVKRVYFNRGLVDLDQPEGILVTVHGLLTNAAWNSDVMPIFSSQGWIVAPFSYGFQTPEILLSGSGRREVLNKFRDWIYDVHRTYGGGSTPISLIAHSFGTYIVGAYLHGFNEVPPVTFESVILTGSILTEDYDWESCVGKKVGRVRNEIAPNDQWVKWMPKKNWLGLDPLFGQAGVKEFNSKSRILSQCENTIFDHNNVIRRDVINQMRLPYLKANKGVMMREFIAKLKSRHA